KISPVEGMLLHNRVKFKDDQLIGAIETTFSGLNMTEIQLRARTTARAIFGEQIPPHNANVSYVMDKCDASWRSRGCKVPLLHCRKYLLHFDEWTFLPPVDDSHYTMF
ncbi:hypothetical protein PENTCL1PPCAC_20885, partial [Pristionchus entomophagus]